MIEFTDIEWANRNMRGKEFGGRGKTHVYLQGRGPFTIHCKTGRKPEKRIGFLFGGSIPGFGPEINAKFTTDPDPLADVEELNYRNLFLSDDGKDQWPYKNFEGELEYRGADCALRVDTDYYLHIDAVEGGHPSWKPQIKVEYISSMSDSVEEIEQQGIPLEINGVPGMWYADILD